MMFEVGVDPVLQDFVSEHPWCGDVLNAHPEASLLVREWASLSDATRAAVVAAMVDGAVLRAGVGLNDVTLDRLVFGWKWLSGADASRVLEIVRFRRT